MFVLWITINPSNLQSLFVLILVGMQYKLNVVNIFVEIFVKLTATFNPIAMAYIFETICYGIFEHLLATGSKDKRLLSSIIIYSDIIKINR